MGLTAQIGVVIVQLLITLPLLHSLFAKENNKKIDKYAWVFPLGALFVYSLFSYFGERLGLSLNVLDTLATSIASNECLLLYFANVWVGEKFKRSVVIQQNFVKYGIIVVKYIALGLGALLTLVAAADLYLVLLK
ncbi:hypothetical protein P9X10_02410 [Bacillus cereus]|nr:hypothetical protein [Bacillus cereus]